MKILLTGEPRVGKSTLVKNLTRIAPDAFWVVTEEVRDSSNIRAGFMAITSTGLKGQFDRRENVVPKTPMDNHHVDVSEIDKLFTIPIQKALDSGNKLLIIDEIGRLQRMSKPFTQVIDRAFESDATILATIHLGDEWTHRYILRSDTVTFTLTLENRDDMVKALEYWASSQQQFGSLSSSQRGLIASFARRYARAGKISSFQKLFQNTVIYLLEKRYRKISDDSYEVKGLTAHHQVSHRRGDWICDCSLFTGRDEFSDKAGECSHIQTIKIVTDSSTDSQRT